MKSKSKIRKTLSLLFGFALCFSLIGKQVKAKDPAVPSAGTLTEAEKQKIKNKNLMPGKTAVFKDANPVSGMVNTWDISLYMTARDVKETSDVVLVIDKSGSMKENSRMAKAIAAANKFVDIVLPDGNSGNTRVSLVSFESNVSVDQALTSNGSVLKQKISSLSANGGTYTQGGLYEARKILNNSHADHKYIVLLSDGEPTFSTSINANINNYDLKNVNVEYAYAQNSNNSIRIGDHSGYAYISRQNEGNAHDLTPDSYRYGTRTGFGAGSYSTESSGSHPVHKRYYDPNSGFNHSEKGYLVLESHANSTINESGFAKKDKKMQVYSIGLQVSNGSNGDYVLGKVASSSSTYERNKTPEQLETVFTGIAGKILSAMKNVKVSDPMGTGFEIPIGEVSNIHISQGTQSYANKKISWDTGTLEKTAEIDGITYRFAKMTYRININDDILALINKDQPIVQNKTYKTNGKTDVSYKDVNGTDKILSSDKGDFDIPAVDPILLIVEKKLIDKNGKEKTAAQDNNKVYNIHVTSDRGYDITYKLKAGERKVMTNLRLEDTYSVTEDNYDFKLYESTIKVYDNEVEIHKASDQNTFKIRQGDPDSPVLVTNREKPGLRISKTVTGNMGDASKDFTINITLKDKNNKPITGSYQYSGSKSGTLTFNAQGQSSISLRDGQNIYIEKLPIGTKYIVKEDQSVEDDGYIISYNGSDKDGVLSITDKDKTGDDSIEIINNKEILTPTGVKSDSRSYIILLGTGVLMIVLMSMRRKKIND